MGSQNYRWKWVTDSLALSHKPCEVLYALFIPSSAATSVATIYNNDEATGEVVVNFRVAQSSHGKFNPKEPVYCNKGLYVDCASNVRGVFVQWREV